MDLRQYSEDQLRQMYRNVAIKNQGLQARLKSAKQQADLELGIKDVNDKVWPFWFVTPGLIEVTPNNSVNTNINVTNEASFVITKCIRTIYLKNEDGSPTFLDGDRKSAGGLIPDLFFQIADSSSTRKWSQRAIHMNVLGTAEKPWTLENPFFLSPNHNLSVEFFNSSPDKTYLVNVVFQGYRFKDPLIDRLSSYVTE